MIKSRFTHWLLLFLALPCFLYASHACPEDKVSSPTTYDRSYSIRDVIHFIEAIEEGEIDASWDEQFLRDMKIIIIKLAQHGCKEEDRPALNRDTIELIGPGNAYDASPFETNYQAFNGAEGFHQAKFFRNVKRIGKKAADAVCDAVCDTGKYIYEHKGEIAVGVVTITVAVFAGVAIAKADPPGPGPSGNENLDSWYYPDSPHYDPNDPDSAPPPPSPYSGTGSIIDTVIDHDTFSFDPDNSLHYDKPTSDDAAGPESNTSELDQDAFAMDMLSAVDRSPESAEANLHLEQSIANFEAGNYDQSIEDFHAFSESIAHQGEMDSFDTAEFAKGFAQGAAEGLYESGKGLALFMADCITEPITTATQVINAFSQIVDLARNDQWDVIGQSLAPEVYELVTEWDSIPPKERGKLLGYATAKHGGDILLPGAIVKVASKTIKGAKQLASACNDLKLANEILVLETAAELANGIRVGEVINAGKTTTFLGEELGLTAKEMGHLKQAGKLEATVQETVEHLSLPMQDSLKLFDRAQECLKPHKGFMSESAARSLIHETGLPTFARPTGIPENFRIKISDRGAGMEYVHPTNNHLRIRVMPGKPHSPWPHQQKPYVVQMKDGVTLDNLGNQVAKHSPEAHIPLEDFVYRD